MAVTTVDRRTLINDADSLTGWTGPDTLVTSPRAEGSYSVGNEVTPSGSPVAFYYTPGTALDLDGHLLYVQSHTNAIQNGWKESTLSDSSHRLYMNDGTNELGLCEAGNDRDVFKHAKTQVAFQSLLIDLDYLGTKNTNGEVEAISGSVASFVKTSVDDVGSIFHTESKALGGGQNCFVDIMRYDQTDTSGDSTTSNSGIFIYGGVNSDPGSFAEVVADDESIAADKGFGVTREYTAGSYGCQGILKFGTTNAVADAYFEDSNFTLTFENRDVNDDKFKIFVFGNSTDTNDFRLSNGTITSAGPGVELDWDSNDIDVLDIDNVTFKDLKRVANFPTDSDSVHFHAVENCTFDNQGKISPGTIDFDNNTIINSASTDQAIEIAYDITALNMVISGYEGTADTGALNWNVNADPDGNIDGSSFTKGTAATHAIEFSDIIPSEITLRNIDFSGYNASDSQNDSTLYFADTGGTITVNLIGCTGNISYKSAGATITLVPDPVTVTFSGIVDNSELTIVKRGATIDTGSDGSTTAGSRNFVTTNSWTPDAYKGHLLYITSGADAGRYYCSGNSATTLYLDTEMTATAGSLTWELYDENDDTEEHHVENTSGDEDWVYSSGAGDDVDIMVINVNYEEWVLLDYTKPSADATIPVSQTYDDNYYNP
jgi:hypothetical protein